MTVKPGPVKRIFAPYKGERLSNLSWDPPPTPPGVRKRRAAEAAAAAYIPPPPTQQPSGDTALPGPPALTKHTTQQALEAEPLPDASSAAAASEEEQQAQAQAQDQPDPSAVSSDEGVVDFMTDDESQNIANHDATNGHSENIGLSRFDDSDDEQMTAPEPLDHSTSGALAVAPDLSRFDDDDGDGNNDDEQHHLSTDAVHQQLASSAVTAAPGLSRLGDGKQEEKQFEAPQPSSATTAAPDLSKRDDSSNVEQVQDVSLHQHPAAAAAAAAAPPAVAPAAAAAVAAEQDMSRFDDSDDVDEEQQSPRSSLPPSQAEPAQVSYTLSSPSEHPASSPASELAADTASDSAPEAASDLASADNAQQLSFSSESDLSGEESSTSDGGNQPDFDSPHDPSDNAVHPYLQHEHLQPPDDLTDLLQHSAAGSQPGSDAEEEQSSADSDLSNATSGSQQPSEVLIGAQTTEDMIEIGDPVEASRSSSDASQRSGSPRPLQAGTALAADAAVAAESPQHADASGAAAQHAEPEEAPLYPGTPSSVCLCCCAAVLHCMVLHKWCACVL